MFTRIGIRIGFKELFSEFCAFRNTLRVNSEFPFLSALPIIVTVPLTDEYSKSSEEPFNKNSTSSPSGSYATDGSVKYAEESSSNSS